MTAKALSISDLLYLLKRGSIRSDHCQIRPGEAPVSMSDIWDRHDVVQADPVHEDRESGPRVADRLQDGFEQGGLALEMQRHGVEPAGVLEPPADGRDQHTLEL